MENAGVYVGCFVGGQNKVLACVSLCVSYLIHDWWSGGQGLRSHIEGPRDVVHASFSI